MCTKRLVVLFQGLHQLRDKLFTVWYYSIGPPATVTRTKLYLIWSSCSGRSIQDKVFWGETYLWHITLLTKFVRALTDCSLKKSKHMWSSSRFTLWTYLKQVITKCIWNSSSFNISFFILDATYEDMKAVLLNQPECRYAACDLEFQHNGQSKSKLAFISW